LRKKLLFGFMAAMLVAGTVLAGCAAPAPGEGAAQPAPVEKVYKWRIMNMEARGGDLWNNVYKFFIDPVKEMSGGRIEMEQFAAGEIVEQADFTEAIATGVAEIALDASIFHPEEIGYSVQFGVPGGCRNNDEWQEFYTDYGYQKYLQDESFTPMGIKLLGHQTEFGNVMTLKESISSFADLEGLKIRTVGSNAKTYENLGASVVTFSVGETYESLATGVIDGASVGALPCAIDRSLHEVCKCFINEPLAPASCGMRMIMNLETWESLPDDLQEILWRAKIEHSARYWQAMKYNEGRLIQTAKDAGVTFYEATAEDYVIWQTAVDKYWKEVLYGEPVNAKSAEMLADFMKLANP